MPRPARDSGVDQRVSAAHGSSSSADVVQDRDLGRLSIFTGGTGQERLEDARSARLVDRAIGRLLVHKSERCGARALWHVHRGLGTAASGGDDDFHVGRGEGSAKGLGRRFVGDEHVDEVERAQDLSLIHI